MKIILILLTLFVSQICFGETTTVFSGQLEGSNKDCKVSYQVRNPEYNLNTIIFESEDMTMAFYNSPMNGDQLPEVTKGLFTYEGGMYKPIIGIPILALGTPGFNFKRLF